MFDQTMKLGLAANVCEQCIAPPPPPPLPSIVLKPRVHDKRLYGTGTSRGLLLIIPK